MDHYKVNTLVFLGCLSDKARKWKTSLWTLVTCDGVYLWHLPDQMSHDHVSLEMCWSPSLTPPSGTPIQNSIKDMWMLLAFLQLKPFDIKEWWNRVIQRPVTQGDRTGLLWVSTRSLTHSLTVGLDFIVMPLWPYYLIPTQSPVICSLSLLLQFHSTLSPSLTHSLTHTQCTLLIPDRKYNHLILYSFWQYRATHHGIFCWQYLAFREDSRE